MITFLSVIRKTDLAYEKYLGVSLEDITRVLYFNLMCVVTWVCRVLLARIMLTSERTYPLKAS